MPVYVLKDTVKTQIFIVLLLFLSLTSINLFILHNGLTPPPEP